MNKTTVDGRRLAYHQVGAGDPVVLLHAGFVADSMVPLLGRPELAGYRLIAPHRRGYGQSERARPPVAMGELAMDLLGLLDMLGIERAHLVGHSFGADVALEAARLSPDRIGSLTLLEPPLGFYLSPNATDYLTAVVGSAMQQFASGDFRAAVRIWLDGAFGPGWQEIVERVLPGAVAQAANDAPAAFGIEAAALQVWTFGPEQLRQIHTPILSVVHPNPAWPGFQEIHAALLGAGAEALEVDLPSHLLQIIDPQPVAHGVAEFLTRHPL
jgi:pimeloyl-ACP methyl ester carboxylesterase